MQRRNVQDGGTVPYGGSLPTVILSRPRLLTRLRYALEVPLTLVIAPAGYGKTVLLAAWVGDLTSGRPPPLVAWIGLEAGHATLASFLLRVAEGLEVVLPGTTESVLRSLEEGEEEAATYLLQHLRRRTAPLVLILDDAHLLGERALAWLDDLLRVPSPALHLVLASRGVPPLASVSRLRAAGRLAEILRDDLRFTAQEVRSLFANVFHHPLTDDQVERLTRRTEGWAVALQLAHQVGLRYGPDRATPLLEGFCGSLSQLYDYLAGVVLRGQPEDRQAFLRRTAILDRLEPALCNALLERDDAVAVLADLERDGLFTFSLDPARTAYRYHALFREFLQRRLEETEGRDAVRRLHRRAAAWHLEQEHYERAIAHLLSAEEYEAAADLFYPLQGQLFPTSRYHLMERWLSRFPPAFTNAHPWLLLCQAKLLTLRGERDRARRLYRRAEPLLHAQEDYPGLYDLYHDLGSIAQDEGDFEAARDFYSRALTYAQDDAQRAVLLGQIARCLYIQNGRVQEALDLMEKAVDLAERSGDPLGRAGLFSLQGKMRSSLGDVKGALEAFHTALDLLEAFGNRHRQVGLLSNAAYHHCLLGQLDQAEAAARRALDLAQTFGRATGYAYALNVLGEVHRRRREYDQARACHLEALTRQQQRNEQYEIAATLNWLGIAARHAGDLNEALRRSQESLNLRRRLGNDYETGLSLIDVGAVHLALGHLDEAGAVWQRALDIFVAADARYEQTQLHFYLAVLAHHRGDGEDLVGHLEQAMEMARTYEHDTPPRCLHLFIEEAAWTAPLMAHALRHGLVPECAECLLARLGRPALEALLPLLEDPDPTVRARAARLLGQLGIGEALRPLAALRNDPHPEARRAAREALNILLATPPEPLRVQTLGGFRLWRGDREIVRWPRRSARDVFLILLAHTPYPVPKDRLMETLWPDAPPEKASQSLRRAIADLRRTLEPELPPGLPSRYVEAGDETYRLQPPAGSWVDAAAFEEALDRATDLPSLEAALDLYHGEYLPELPYDDWTLARRERLRQRFVEGLTGLARLYLEAERPREAADAARRALEQDPWDEEAVLLSMQAYAALGDVPAALRIYETLRDRLRRDLDLSPRSDLTALYERLRR